MYQTRSHPIRFPMPGQTVIVNDTLAIVKGVFPHANAIETTKGRFYAWVLSSRIVGRVTAHKH